jgi:hypothetical protein
VYALIARTAVDRAVQVEAEKIVAETAVAEPAA